MKKIIALALITFSGLSLASEPLLLDASCKIRCLVEVVQIHTFQTSAVKRVYETLYIDYVGVSRQQIDTNSKLPELDKVCRTSISEKAVGESSDCLTFKH